MKMAYSTFSTETWKMFKSVSSKRTESDYCEFAGRMWKEVCRQSESCTGNIVWERDSLYVDLSVEFLWKYRKINHYFLAPGVAEFCVSSVKELNADYCKTLPVCEPVDKPFSLPDRDFIENLEAFGQGSPDKVLGGFAIHFPSKERTRSIMVIPNMIVPVPPEAIPNNVTGQGGMMKYYFAAADGKNVVLSNKSTNYKDFGADETTYWIPKFVFGLSLYMDAFPETVVKGGAESVHQIKHYSGSTHMVGRNEMVDEEASHSVSPHWRRGHFRLLSSEKFVRKHGQTVFVRGTFVKGKAFDVLDDTQERLPKRWENL